jgi:hypothetical protein
MALLAILLTATCNVYAQLAIKEAVRYDDHRLVDVELTSVEQLELLEAIDAVILNCRIGVGPLRIVLAPEKLGALDAAGIRHRILNNNVQALIDAERQRLANQGGLAGLTNACDDGWFDDYKSLADIQAQVDDIADTFPDVVEKVVVGTSIENRPIEGLRITSAGGAPGRPAVLFAACQHAREWVSPMVAVYIAKQLACSADTDPEIQALLDQIEFFVIPVVNPDGYLYTWTDNRFWRKNRRQNFPSSEYGVDLNRNWGVDWAGPESTSSNPSSDVYYGTSPFSEPETSALRDFILARPQIVATIDFHSYSQIILQSWGHTNDLPLDFPAIDALGELMSQAAVGVNGFQYPHGSGDALIYLASGVCPDWIYSTTGAFAYTIELRPSDPGGGGFELPPAQIYDTCTENLAAVTAMAQWARQGVQFVYPAGLPTNIPAGATYTVQVDLSETYETIEAGSPKLLSRVGTAGPFTSASLTQIAGNSYQGTLPAAPCDEIVQYYFELDTEGGTTYRDPSDAPTTLYEVISTESELVAEYDFQADPGWAVGGTAAQGAWERGEPAGDGERADPTTDFDGSGACYLTWNIPGNSDVDDGTTSLTTGVFDLAGGGTVSYAYWLDDIPTGALGAEDGFAVEMATDAAGTNWQTLREYKTPLSAWRSDVLFVDAAVATSTVRFRFSVSDLPPGDVVEGALDAVVVSRAGCPTEDCLADVAGNDGVVDVVDLLALLSAWGSNDPTFDINDPPDGVVNVSDLLALLALWGPCP